MGKAIPTQHPAVVLRSHYRHVRALLAVALVAVLGLTAAVVILATDGNDVAGTSSARPAVSIESGGFAPATGSTRYDGGPEEGTRGLAPGDSAANAGIRYDGGPEEGTAGPGR
jgi:hypothetical protein